MRIVSANILHDVSNILRWGETNYVMATMSLFLNIYDVFVSPLIILLAFLVRRD